MVYSSARQVGNGALMIVLAAIFLPSFAATPGVIPTSVGKSDSLSVVLDSMPPKYQNLDGSVLQFFSAAADSAFLWGPNGPHPYSWLHSNIVVLKPFDFSVEFCTEDGVLIDTVAFTGVKPGVYRLGFVGPNKPASGFYLLRYIDQGEVVHERKMRFVR